MDRRGFLSLVTRTTAAASFVAVLPRWYGTAAQWRLHDLGCLRLWSLGRLTEVPASALQRFNSTFVPFLEKARPGNERFIGYWSTGPVAAERGRSYILAWVDKAGRAWWAKP